MGVCAALAVAFLGVGVLNGTIPLLRIGGSSGSGGGGHDEASTFMSYAGPIFPLTLGEENDSITAERNTTLDFSPWEPVWVESEYREEGGYWSRSSDILVTDSYTLTNSSGEDQAVTVLYPFVSGLYETDRLRPLLTLDGRELQTELRIGTYSGSFEGAWAGTIGGDPDGSVNLNYADGWEDYQALLADGSYLTNALGPGPDVTGVPVTVYRLTNPRTKRRGSPIPPYGPPSIWTTARPKFSPTASTARLSTLRAGPCCRTSPSPSRATGTTARKPTTSLPLGRTSRT